MTILHIDRTKSFDPDAFFIDNCSIVEEDERSLKLTKVDLSQISFEMMPEKYRDYIVSEEKSKRGGNIHLDAKIFQTLWENQHLIPSQWKDLNNGITFICFGGTFLRNLNGHSYVLYLYWDGDEWEYQRYCFSDVGDEDIRLSAVHAKYLIT